MLTRQQGDELILEALQRVKGIAAAVPFADEDREKVRAIEAEVETKSLLGLGKVINTGVSEVLACDWVYVALTTMEFDWACGANLLMKKGDDVVGEEVWDKETIARLASDKNAWFMHKNFVVYKDKVAFPKDVMQKVCYFEIPGHPATWPLGVKCHSIFYGSPATPCDVFLRERYFEGLEEKGKGTVLIGVKL
jgi:hypothetical protein